MRAVALALFTVFALTACPDPDEVAEDVGGAPKRQLDAVQDAVDDAAQRAQDRLNRTGDE